MWCQALEGSISQIYKAENIRMYRQLTLLNRTLLLDQAWLQSNKKYLLTKATTTSKTNQLRS